MVHVHEQGSARPVAEADRVGGLITVTAPPGLRVPARVRPREVSEPASVPKLYRRRGDRLIAGVAGGLSDHLGVSVLWVRLTFAVLGALGGAGLLAYLLLWVLAPQREETADRQASKISDTERQQAIGIAALGIGLAVATGTLTGVVAGWAALPLALVLIGAIVVWREADEAQRRRWIIGSGGWLATVRIVAGVALVMTGIGVVVLREGDLGQVQFALLAVIATLVGVAVLTVPFWLRLVRDLGEERRARIRTEERAEIAAHLHDSVLQTLALIQKQSSEPREVARLARAQERQLRNWLYSASGYARANGDADSGQQEVRFSEALAVACGEVEDSFAISVQHVVVGDSDLGQQQIALIQAAREAMVNAAKHAGVDEVSVYAEVEQESVSVFVRDRGCGFDLGTIPADRHGLADSIRGRMERNGGTCSIRTEPGQGTEVRLTMPVTAREGTGTKQ